MKYCIAKLTLVQSSDVYDYEQEGPPRAHRTPITRRAFSLSNDHTLLGETGWLNTSEYYLVHTMSYLGLCCQNTA